MNSFAFVFFADNEESVLNNEIKWVKKDKVKSKQQKKQNKEN